MRDSDFFYEVTLALVSSLDLTVALRRVVACCQAVMPVERLVLTQIEADLGAIRLLATVTSTDGEHLDTMIPLPPQRARTLARDFWSDQAKPAVLVMTEPEDDILGLAELGPAVQLPFPPIPRMFQVLSLPDRRVAGMVFLPRAGERFTDEHARLLSLINEPCALALSNALQHMELARLKDGLTEQNRFLHRELDPLRGQDIVGADFGLKTTLELVRRVAPQEATVLLLGETGVGKDVFASAIHASSPRRDGPLVKVNCGALPDSLIDSELFGHERGAFTGAVSRRLGRFERADHGTIFLDEVAELPPSTQARLLRVLQTRDMERVGGDRSIQLDLRVVAATHRDLETMVKQGSFREDLFFRLDVFPIVIPPLRERREDLPALVRHFIRSKGRRRTLGVEPALAEGAMETLLAYDWPGNVRELENVIERAMILDPEGPLRFDWLTPRAGHHDEASTRTIAGESLALDATVARHIRRVLDLAGGKIAGPGGAAELLGLHPNTLRSKMKKLGIGP